MDELSDQENNTPINQLLSLTSEKETARRAVNQLLLIIAGSTHSKATDGLQNAPKSRLKKCTELAMEEYSIAQSLLQDCVPDARRMITQAQQKLDSLNSLSTLANVVELMP